MNKISTKHLMLFFIGAFFISIKTYPSLFIKLGGRDTWICAIIASILFLLYALYLMHIMKKHKTYNLINIFKSAASSPIGMFLISIFAFNLFLSSIESAAVYSNVLKVQYFSDTPVWYIVALFLIPSVLILKKDIRTLCTFVIVSISLLILNIFVFLVLVEPYKDLNFIMPVMANSINIDFVKCTLTIFFSFCSFAIALPFMKYLNNGNYLKKHTFLSLSISLTIIVFCISGIIAYFGPDRAINLLYAEAIQGQRIDMAGFVEFGELFFIFQTVIGFLIKYILSSFAFMCLFKKLLENRFLFILIYTFLTFSISTLISMNNYYLSQFLGIYNIINGIIFFVVPFILFTIFNFKSSKNYKTFTK